MQNNIESGPGQGIVFRQLYEETSWTYSYLIGDLSSKEAVIIDPVFETVDRDEEQIKALGLNLIYAINTHVHADHITGSGKLKKRFPGCKSVLGAKSGGKADKYVKNGEILKFGKQKLECRSTPGHTNGCTTFVLKEHNMAFTGDTLLIRACGRTDFQEGSADTLYGSIWYQIMTLPPQTKLYPGHDYKGRTWTTVEEEKRLNPRITKKKAEFIRIMDNLNLPYPRKLDISLPANKEDGLAKLPDNYKLDEPFKTKF